MLVPSIFGESLLDDFVNDFAFPYAPAKKVYGKEAASLMRTDVKETKTGYELEIELPGVKKEDVKAELKDGYLTITASTDSKKEEKQDGKYIRKERYSGTTSRSFYVGEGHPPKTMSITRCGATCLVFSTTPAESRSRQA